MGTLQLIAGWIVVVFIGVAGAIVLWHMIVGNIKLEKLISEDDGTASLSRFQFLVFTIVIAMSLFLIVVGNKPLDFPEDIPPEIMALLGISGGSYVISKGIQKGVGGNAGKGPNDKDGDDKGQDPPKKKSGG